MPTGRWAHVGFGQAWFSGSCLFLGPPWVYVVLEWVASLPDVLIYSYLCTSAHLCPHVRTKGHRMTHDCHETDHITNMFIIITNTTKKRVMTSSHTSYTNQHLGYIIGILKLGLTGCLRLRVCCLFFPPSQAGCGMSGVGGWRSYI